MSRQPVRALHVITRFSGGGSEQRLRDVVRAVAGEHHVVVGRDSGAPQVEELAEHAAVTWSDSLVREIDPARDLRALRQLHRLLRDSSFDVVHTHQAKGGFLGRVAARAARVPTVYHSASMASFGPGYGIWESRAFALAERVTAPLVRRYFVVGDDLADRLARNGIARRRLQVVRSSLDLSGFTPPSPAEQLALRRRLGLATEGPLLCYVGSLERRKGVDVFASLLPRVRAETGTGTGLVIAGDGPLRNELAETFAARLGPGAVTMLGHVPYVADVMRAADVIILPSAAEGLPQVLVQAAACGLPFVAFDVDGVGELLRLGAHGRSVPLGDRTALATAVIAVLRETAPSRTCTMAPRVLDQWSSEAVARNYQEAYAADIAR